RGTRHLRRPGRLGAAGRRFGRARPRLLAHHRELVRRLPRGPRRHRRRHLACPPPRSRPPRPGHLTHRTLRPYLTHPPVPAHLTTVPSPPTWPPSRLRLAHPTRLGAT